MYSYYLCKTAFIREKSSRFNIFTTWLDFPLRLGLFFWAVPSCMISSGSSFQRNCLMKVWWLWWVFSTSMWQPLDSYSFWCYQQNYICWTLGFFLCFNRLLVAIEAERTAFPCCWRFHGCLIHGVVIALLDLVTSFCQGWLWHFPWGLACISFCPITFTWLIKQVWSGCSFYMEITLYW